MRYTLLIGFSGALLICALLLMLTSSPRHTQPANAGAWSLTGSMISFDPGPQSAAQPKAMQRTTQNTQQDEPGLDPAGFLVPVTSFTYQGVLNDLNGNPAQGPISLRFQISADQVFNEITNTFTMSDTVFDSIMPDEDGRFQVQVPLPDAGQLNSFIDHRLQIFDVDADEQIGDDVTMYPAPFAWSAQHAKRADKLSTEFWLFVFPQPGFEAFQFGNTPIATRVGNLVTLSGDINPTADHKAGALIAKLQNGTRSDNRFDVVIPTGQFLTNGNPRLLTLRIDGENITLRSPNLGQDAVFKLDGITFLVRQ